MRKKKKNERNERPNELKPLLANPLRVSDKIYVYTKLQTHTNPIHSFRSKSTLPERVSFNAYIARNIVFICRNEIDFFIQLPNSVIMTHFMNIQLNYLLQLVE